MIALGSSKSAIRAKVKRFVEGRRDPRDLDAIFLWVRSKSFGAKIVKDIGDFVAHAEEKNQGFIWDRASLIATMLRYKIPEIQKIDSIACENGLNILRSGVMATFNLDDAASVKAKCGIGQRQARKTLESGLKKIEVRYEKYAAEDLTESERKLIQIYSGMLILQPAYSETQLITELAACLNKNGLLSDAEIPAILSSSQYVAVYAIERMHLCKLVINGHSSCLLSAGVSDAREGGYLTVNLSIDVEFDDKSVVIGSTIFTMECSPVDWVDGTLWLQGMKGSWTVPIELGPYGRLTEAI